MICARCGAPPEPGDIFCADCGSPLVVAPPAVPPIAVPPTAVPPTGVPPTPIIDIAPVWDEPDDETVVVQRRPKIAPWLLVLESGRRIRVDARALVGRGASFDSRWSDAALVHVTDPTKTVSKTHTLVEVDGDLLWFTDLDSTNGMSIARAGGEPVQLISGVRESAAAGDLVHLGQFTIRIEREPMP